MSLYSDMANQIEKRNLDIPIEYTCPISFEIMLNPVYIKQHPKQRFEKKSLEDTLKEKNENPFTREHLDLSGFENDYVFQKEIYEWMKGQLSESDNNSSAYYSSI
jgi:glutathionylspermidine synthase